MQFLFTNIDLKRPLGEFFNDFILKAPSVRFFPIKFDQKQPL